MLLRLVASQKVLSSRLLTLRFGNTGRQLWNKGLVSEGAGDADDDDDDENDEDYVDGEEVDDEEDEEDEKA